MRGCADDRAAATQVEALGLLAQAGALFVLKALGDPDALAGRRVDHVTACDRQVHRQARALGLERVLDDLDDHFLPGFEHLADRLALGPGVTTTGHLDPRDDDLVDVQKAVLVEPDVDESCFEAGQHVVDAPLVDVSDDRTISAALQVELCGTPACGWAFRLRRRVCFHQRDARFSAIDAN